MNTLIPRTFIFPGNVTHSIRPFTTVLTSLMLLITPLTSHGDDFDHRSPTTNQPTPGSQGGTNAGPQPRSVVTKAYVKNFEGQNVPIQANTILVVEVQSMSNTLASIRLGKKLIPYLDGIPLPDIEGTIPDTESNCIVFYLKRTPSNRDAFDRLLLADGYGTKNITLSIGTPTEGPWPTEVGEIGFKRLSAAATIKIAICLIAYVAISLFIAFRSKFLRDPIPAATAKSDKLPPFSLAKVQFFLWFSAIFSAFILIYVTTGDFNSIPTSMFVLLGVSGATPAVALFQDRLKDPTINLPPQVMPPMPVTNTFRQGGWRKGGFLWDLISDSAGLSWNRVQMLIVTIALLIIFVKSVALTLTIPAFSSELAALMGISAGTFLLGLSSESHSSQQ